jgi:hypothetical protein
MKLKKNGSITKALLKKNNKVNIIFTDLLNFELQKPNPASKFIPDWYKRMESYTSGEKKPSGEGKTTATIKRCMPVFDAITTGYILTTPVDIFVSQKNGEPWYEWVSSDILGFHPVEQAPEHPHRNGLPSYPKFANSWSIKTPKGYSCLFVQPFHREAPFTILPGIVDTDNYTSPVNFPFVLNNSKFEGLIPAGTPMVQVIPFKRNKWTMIMGNEKNKIEAQQIHTTLRTHFFDGYKKLWWDKKEYK